MHRRQQNKRAQWRLVKYMLMGWLMAVGDLSAAEIFQIQPQQPIAKLLPQALAAQPPDEPGPHRPANLVELIKLDPSFKLDIRYAGTSNFLGTALYSQARAFLQQPAALALVRVLRRVKLQGYGLMIFDAYRPWYITQLFWAATPVELHHYVADPALGSRHNRGCAVDLTLYRLADGAPVKMPSGYDEMTERAHANYAGGDLRARQQRAILRAAMEAEGFSAYPWEWWHFDYRDWQEYALANRRFEDLP